MFNFQFMTRFFYPHFVGVGIDVFFVLEASVNGLLVSVPLHNLWTDKLFYIKEVYLKTDDRISNFCRLQMY